MLSLNSRPSNLPNGRFRGNKIVCSGPEAASKKGWKKNRRTLTIYDNGDDIGVNCHHPDQDPIACKDWARAHLGLPAWKPRARKPTRDPIPQRERNQFFAETLNVLRYWKYLDKPITAEQFNLLINDLRPKDETTMRWARWYASEFGFEVTYTKHYTYTADERAKILGVTYAERQWLGLKRTGSIDVDKAGRERARRDRGNAAKRAKRAIERAAKTNQQSRLVPDACKRGVNRQVPSLEAVVVTRIELESEDKTLCNKPRAYKSTPKIPRTDHKNRPRQAKPQAKSATVALLAPKPPDSIPFQERVGLMI